MVYDRWYEDYWYKLYAKAIKSKKKIFFNELNGQTDPKMAIVALSKQTDFNQDSVMLQIFFKQNKQ